MSARYVEVVPAYGRDYRSKKAVMEAWNENKDFQVVSDSFALGDAHGYLNKLDFEKYIPDAVILVRYGKGQKVMGLE